MPELPEVEITRRGIAEHLTGEIVTDIVVREARLRYPVPNTLGDVLRGQRIENIDRRAKYLLLNSKSGTVIIHLGMSGSLRVLPSGSPAQKHDHVDIVFGARLLRLRDPRRFGAILWSAPPIEAHPLLAGLGIEPLTTAFDGEVLYAATRGRKTSIKLFIMDARIVVGVGNIYASESLFRARIHPNIAAGKLSRARCDRLAAEIRATLTDALAAGGSSLRDFVASDGASGYFQQQYTVYGREGKACRICSSTIRRVVMGQRSTFYCPSCQK
ncbi:MAG TPA: bifunctional DNA-formamidopyrimidine glycosylase/DNA-(apurinic or apyrimidinic site) lyase [Rhodocyclaceae bacterium]|nr:bifunctional DNA-formamidopyrimidine glycosylase/DNA-(apurinic or apyrimidinic site) lyase [Rhodocyclaceae bacterium]